MHWAIRIASWLVPADRRADWRKEWDAELWHHAALLRSRGKPESAVREALWRHARGAFADAAGLGVDVDLWRHEIQSPRLCLIAVAVLFCSVLAATGGFATLRALLSPLPYARPAELAVVAQRAPFMGQIIGVPARRLRDWQTRAAGAAELAGYYWRDEVQHGRTVRVGYATANFYSVLGADPQRSFWFLSRKVDHWVLLGPNERPAMDFGVVARVHPGTNLRALLAPRENTLMKIDVLPLRGQIAASRILAAVALAIALLIVIIARHVHMGRLAPLDTGNLPKAQHRRYRLFLAGKIVPGLLAVAGGFLEWSGAPWLTTNGTSDFSAPLFTWMLALAFGGVLWWSLVDQRDRCRWCLTRLSLPVTMGEWGSALLDPVGTELVCRYGHGALYSGETPSLHPEPDRWTNLDSTWSDLFTHHGK